MHQTHPSTRRSWRSRGLSLVLALALLLGLVPGLDLGGDGSAHWADTYLNQLVEWGFIRPDQAQQPGTELTRADFMAITNRAYGYSENGPTPFEDIKETDWFYDDVGIAYTAQYIKGTSETTASPNETLTRETAATILGRNMMLQESEGEILDFSDARDISFWSKGVIKSSLEHYLVSGYDDGTFRPQNSVTWGEMAAMVSRIVGTPLQEAGDYSLGGVFGNVTISSPGVTLRDTVISGDLYITGGVGLGGIKLENVTVLGRIICSGTGEAENGEASILLRNVTADELLVDSLQGKTVSVQADGITEIGKTRVRTSAYLEDNTPEGMGLMGISLESHVPEEGEDADPIELTVSGRIEEVTNKTPESTVHVAKGTLGKLNIDEAATDSQVIIDRGAEVKEVNLDTATHVTGEGDIKNLNVNAPGCVVDILPEQITIRPGITAEIDGEEMDTVDAEESNREPQILSGYPLATDIAPNSISAIFATNKKGTVYWAVSPITDGSVATEDIIKPPVYGGISVARGSVASPSADTEVRAAVTGLVPGGSYYLSAVMVDDRGVQSPTKVIAFETPDNSIPAFAQGYPYFSLIEDTRAQVAVMPTKDCNLYYAVLPSGAAAPTEDELKTNSVSGALGYGVRPVTKNVADLFWVNDLPLEEQVTYDLYLWLVDTNGANKSPITKLSFTTVDKTPPEFIIDPTPNSIQERNVGLTFRLNENGTVYWAIVPAGKEFLLPNRAAGQTTVDWSGEYAKLQVTSGLNAQSFGNVRATQNADGTINVTGLQAETAYDFYYVAVDTAGNYSRTVKMITINSLDNNGPKFSQTFSKYSGLDNTVNPMVDTDIILRVTENIRADVEGAGEDLLSLYEASIDRTSNEASRLEAKDKLVTSLRSSIILNRVTSGSGQGSRPVTVRYDQLPSVANRTENNNWVIDYEQTTVTMVDGVLEITFPESALNLDSGGTYYFTVSNITDTSTAENRIVPSTIDFYTNAAAGAAAGHDLRPFTTMLGQIYLTRTGLDTATELPKVTTGTGADAVTTDVPIDFSFRAVPRSTKDMEDNMSYEMLFFTDSVIAFDLYYRVVHVDADGRNPQYVTTDHPLPNWATRATNANNAGWWKLGGNSGSGLIRGNSSARAGVTLNGQFNGCNQGNYPKLNELMDDGQYYYEFAISITQKDSSNVRTEWSGDVNLTVYVGAGPSTNLSTLTRMPTFDRWDDTNNAAITNKTSFLANGLANGGGVSIGITDMSTTYLSMDWPFTDSRIPKFEYDYPHITPGDTFVDMEIALDQTSPGSTIAYVIAPVGGINPRVIDQRTDTASDTPLTDAELWSETPVNGSGNQPGVPSENSTPSTPAKILSPEAVAIAEHMYNNNTFKMGKITYEGNNVRVPVNEQGLMPNTNYYVYFVFSNTSGEMSPIYMYKFTTNNLSKPMIDLARANGVVNATTHVDAVLDYTIATSSQVRTMQQFSNDPRYLLVNNLGVDEDGVAITSSRLPDNYRTISILDAMIQPYTVAQAKDDTGIKNGSDEDYAGYYIPPLTNSTTTLGYSLFDVYASDSIKGTVAALIRNGSSVTGYAASGTKETSMTPVPIDERDKMSIQNVYMLLSVAHHKSGTIDSFKAVDNVTIPDETAPYPINVTTYIPDDGVTDGIRGKLYSGRVTIRFNKDLYWLPRNATSYDVVKPVYNTNTTASSTDSWIDILTPTTSTASQLTVYADSMTPTQTFSLNFTGMTENGEIELFTNGLFAGSGGTAEPNSFVLRFTISGTQAGFTSDWSKNRVEYKLANVPETAADLTVTSIEGQDMAPGNNALIFDGLSGNLISSYAVLRASVTPNPENYNYSWSCPANNSVIEFEGGSSTTTSSDRNVRVKAIGIGSTTITVRGGSFTKTITVEVKGAVTATDQQTNTTVNTTNGQIDMVTGQQAKTLSINIAPASLAANTSFTWTSSNASVVSVTGNASSGTLSANSRGSATITVTATGGVQIATFQVSVTDPVTSQAFGNNIPVNPNPYGR